MIQEIFKTINQLHQQHFGKPADKIEKLPVSGSSRTYFRLFRDNETCIGAFNTDVTENEAFFSFTQTFRELNLHVPELFTISDDRKYYLQSDLGDQSLYDSIWKGNVADNKKTALCHIKKSLIQLIQFQLQGAKHIDFSKCYPRDSFDSQSIQWDLNYFKYNFLKLAQVPYNEQKLEDDFQEIIRFMNEIPSDYFMYRDFQSRNIMIIHDNPYFIDYQGGRKGPLQYDLASLLFSPKTKANKVQQETLFEFYLDELKKEVEIDSETFKKQYHGVVLLRILQAMGAYGYRGIFEKKNHFINSLPSAIANLSNLIEKDQFPLQIPEIKTIIGILKASDWAKTNSIPKDKLTVRITSFSYKKGIPDDPSANGGGYAFDCRGLPNPGRYSEYRSLSGLDQEVKDYFKDYPEVDNFQENVRKIVKISLDEYVKRGFNHLCVNFGCTGGQHRSVFNAENFAAWVENNFPVDVVVIHTEKNNWKKDE